MSFSFSFSGDDIDPDESENDNNTNTPQTTNLPSQAPPPAATATPILIPPKRHTLRDLLASLPSQISYNYLNIPVTNHDPHIDGNAYANANAPTNNTNIPSNSSSLKPITTSTTTTNGSLRVPRRALFDIRQQLMAEDDFSSPSTSTTTSTTNPIYAATATATAAATTSHTTGLTQTPPPTTTTSSSLLTGLETGDLHTGIYEGGFKTWECAVDLAGFVAGSSPTISEICGKGDGKGNGNRDFFRAMDVHVVELGAGSAVPSLVLLQRVLRERIGGVASGMGGGDVVRMGRVRFTLCDYNEDVLRLGTAANLFLTVVLSGCLGEKTEEDAMDVDGDVNEEDDEEGDLDVDEALIDSVLYTLERANVEIDFVSGAWGSDFVDMLQLDRQALQSGTSEVLVLASETIYSPASLGFFSQTILDIMRAGYSDEDDVNCVKALVASKKVYFGVGGGIREFEEVLRQHGGQMSTVFEVKDAGVGRAILQVSDGGTQG